MLPESKHPRHTCAGATSPHPCSETAIQVVPGFGDSARCEPSRTSWQSWMKGKTVRSLRPMTNNTRGMTGALSFLPEPPLVYLISILAGFGLDALWPVELVPRAIE